MSWSWSHTTEAYHYARKRLHSKPKGTLGVIWAEWKTYHKAQAEAREEARKEAEENEWTFDPDSVLESRDFDQAYYKEKRAEAKDIVGRVGKEPLADEIWEWASEYATCTNGGWKAYMCPYGCECHMVPFSKEKRGA